MSDLAMTRSSNGFFDLEFSRGDFVLTNSLRNCVLLSLGCWARDEEITEVATIEPSIGGWWGNSLEDVEIGSQIWKLFKQKLDDPTALNAAAAAEKALKWMVDDGVAKSVAADAVINGKILEMTVSIQKPDASGEKFRWQINWEDSL